MSESKETTVMAEDAVETIETTPADGADAVVDVPDAGDVALEVAGANPPGRSLSALVSGHGLQIAGIAIFSAASLAAAVLLSGQITLDSSAEQRDERARREEDSQRVNEQAIDPSITGDELVRMGEAALDEGRFASARRYLDEARMRVESVDVSLRIDLFSALARAEELAGREDLARLHRDYLSRLRESMGGSIELFNEAEVHLREGRLRQARVLYSKFLLSPKLGEAGDRYLVQARDRLARVMEREFTAASPDAMKMPLEPESYFDD